MTKQDLEALLLDEALGELPGEVKSLLEAFLATSPARHEEARMIRETLRESLLLTGEVVATCPELFAPAPTARRPAVPGWLPLPGTAAPWMKLAAAFFALALAAGAGYRSGRDHSEGGSRTIAETVSPETLPLSSPWARYRVAADGRLAVVTPAQP